MYQQHVPPHQIKHSLPTITVKHPQTGDLITWRMSQPVTIWSTTASKWCPGEISYITQDADGYCLDVRYWAKPQLPKAKYLAPLSDCLRPISSDFVCRNEWASGSKVECFSNSQKRWYKATVVDVIRYPDDKEDWLKIQWSLETSNANTNSTPCSNTSSNAPQIMSKEVGRSSIWIRHRYPPMKYDKSPLSQNTSKQQQQQAQNAPRKQNKAKKKKKQSNKMNDEVINDIISSNAPTRGPPSKDLSFTDPDGYNKDTNIRVFEAQNHSMMEVQYTNGPSIPTKSKKLSSTSSGFASLTPQLATTIPNIKDTNNNEVFDYILKRMEANVDDKKEDNAEFGAEYKPSDYKDKNLDDLDEDLDKAFMSSDSSEEENEDEEEDEEEDEDEEKQNEDDDYGSNGGSVRIRSTEEDDEEEESESEDEVSSDDDKKDPDKPPVLLQSGSRLASSHGNMYEEDKKELLREISDLKFRLEIAEQDLNEERETSGPLLKEVEIQKIQIAKLEEVNHKLTAEFDSDKNTDLKKKHKKHHHRSLSFTSSTFDQRSLSSDDDLDKTQQLIDAVYDRKVTMLNEKMLRMLDDCRKKDVKIAEYKQNEVNIRREIQLLESELGALKRSNKEKNRSDTQNITMYRDQVRKLTQTNDLLKKALQTADDNLKSAELKKQDLSEEFRLQRQITNNLQQKVQRVLQQNKSITAQCEALQNVLNKYNNNSLVNNHLDTIRKCNMRSIQILVEIVDKNRRKISSEYERYHSTKSTRFSDKKSDKKSNKKSANNVFDFESAPIPYSSDNNSTRSRGFEHHQQLSEQIDNNKLNGYNRRIKRVSYDYVDGSQIQQNYKRKKHKLYQKQELMIDENQEIQSDDDEYLDKIWTVKFPQKTLKQKTKIITDKTQIIFKCEQIKHNIKHYDISEKRNVNIYTNDGKKYKIKCDNEKESNFWHKTLNNMI